MDAFYYKNFKRDRLVEITPAAHLQPEEWNLLKRFYEQKIQEGYQYMNLDLRQLQFISSIVLGWLIEWNTRLGKAGGELRLVLQRDSKIAHLIEMTRLNQVIHTWQT